MLEIRRIELRASEGVVDGVAVRYGDIAVVNGQPERFLPASLLPAAPSLRFMHDDTAVLAETVKLIATPEAMKFEARIADPYRQPLEGLIASGLIGGASIGFRALEERMTDGVREISLARLEEISLVDRGAYPQSNGLQMRRADDSAAMGRLEYRQSDSLIRGVIQLGVPGIVSLARRRRLLLPREADISFADNVFLLDGYSYENALASTGAGSLNVRRVRDTIAFETVTRALARTPALRTAQAKMRAGLLNGVVPGLQRIESETRTEDIDGVSWTTEVIKKAGVCELNTTARSGSGYSGSLSGGRRRGRGR